MAKYPLPGRVKTRLMPLLTGEQAAGVQRVFLTHVAHRLAGLNPAELVICFDPPDAAWAMQELLNHSWANSAAKPTWMPQCAGDLGARLADAAGQVGKRHPAMLFFGVDSPDVPLNHIIHAAELARTHPVSLSPTDDGGFWSLGLSSDVPVERLLKNIAWSSGIEREQTLRQAGEMGYRGALGKPWDDIDRPEDLRRLMLRLKMERLGDEATMPEGGSNENLLRRLLAVWDERLAGENELRNNP